jgi:hypothetical protein
MLRCHLLWRSHAPAESASKFMAAASHYFVSAALDLLDLHWNGLSPAARAAAPQQLQICTICWPIPPLLTRCPAHLASHSAAEAVEAGKDTAVTVPKELANQEEPKGAMGKLVKALTYGTSVDIHEVRGWLLGLGLGLPSASAARRVQWKCRWLQRAQRLSPSCSPACTPPGGGGGRAGRRHPRERRAVRPQGRGRLRLPACAARCCCCCCRRLSCPRCCTSAGSKLLMPQGAFI